MALALLGFANPLLAAISTPFGTSYQVNVDALGQNIPGDAANEPSLCIDPTNPKHLAIGWRQFDTTNSNFRQAGWGYSTNGGVSWTLGGVLETNVFRSDPVLATDADGQFYYLSLKNSPTFFCDLWKSTNGGMNWQRVGLAEGGDKAWMTIDRTASPGGGNIYQDWDTAQPNVYSNRIFGRSVDLGATWLDPVPIPHTPEWGTLDVGPNGEVYLLGRSAGQFWLNRSLNVTNNSAVPSFDLTVLVDLGGLYPGIATSPVNPGGLLGQPWIAVDKSAGPTRGNLYALCSIVTSSDFPPPPSQISFNRSINGGTNWSAPIQINTDAAYTNSWHWFGTLSVAPNGRIDACWYDTRSDTNNVFSELYYCYSLDGGLSWASNRPISPPFDASLGYPQQDKIGDYIGMVSLDEAACIAYSATFNGEQDIYFVRVEQPITLAIARTGMDARLSWNAVVRKTYCLQYKGDLISPWPVGTNQVCLVATNTVMTLADPLVPGTSQRFYRVVTQP